ncbi:MAG: FAD-dependent oxidoreductase [Chloroflexia bacterium]|nr:FAD-dependent oxidoreductase [Chloroflexia bacterium]
MTALVVVVGAGPAGLAAATEAARAGAATILLEERAEPGGRLPYAVQLVAIGPVGNAERPAQLLERLVGEALSVGVAIRTGALVAGCFAGNEILVIENDRASRITPDALIVTTGATNLPFPFAGATFPGVFSAQGLQILLNQHRVRPGRRFAVIGGGEDAEVLVSEIMLAGGEVIWSGIAPASFLRAEGAAGVHALIVGQERHEVEVIAIAVGRQADPALATMAGASLGLSPALGGLVPLVDDRMESSVRRLFVAGDAAGAGSVAVAIAEGRLAGVAVAMSLGLVPETDVGATRAAGGDELEWRLASRRSIQGVTVQPYE